MLTSAETGHTLLYSIVCVRIVVLFPLIVALPLTSNINLTWHVFHVLIISYCEARYLMKPLWIHPRFMMLITYRIMILFFCISGLTLCDWLSQIGFILHDFPGLRQELVNLVIMLQYYYKLCKLPNHLLMHCYVQIGVVKILIIIVK